MGVQEMILILMGSVGSGKGTIGGLLERSLGIPLLGTGELLREEIAKNSELGKEVQQYMNKGQLVPDEVMISVLTKKLDLLRKGCILDGFPRTLPQLKALEKYLGQHKKEIDGTFYLDIPDELAIERLSNRLNCTNCHRIYNVTTNSPQVTGICDTCGKALSTRADDQSQDTIRQRLKNFKMQTKPLIKELEQKKLLVYVDATRKPQEILADILKGYSVPK